MQFRIGFDEIQRPVSEKTGKNIPMCYGGTHTLRISYEVNMLIKTTSVGLDINVDRVSGKDVFLSYGGGAGIDFMVRQALNRVKNQPGMDMLELLEGSCMVLHLGKSPQLSQVFDRVTLRDISFDEHFVIIDFVPNSL